MGYSEFVKPEKEGLWGPSHLPRWARMAGHSTSLLHTPRAASSTSAGKHFSRVTHWTALPGVYVGSFPPSSKFRVNKLWLPCQRSDGVVDLHV